jgi:hypothetical protein
MLPITEQFIDNITHNPDFYGPFWILATIVSLLSVIGNISNYLSIKFTGEEWKS